jgi:hypothetical protein
MKTKVRSHSQAEHAAWGWLVREKPGGQFLRSLFDQQFLWRRSLDPVSLWAKWKSPFTEKQWICLLKSYKKWLDRAKQEGELRKLISEIEGRGGR